MATRISSLCRINMGMAHLLFRNTIRNGVRTIYTESAIGMESYERVRNNFRSQFTNVDGLFRKKMEEVCEDETSMVFTEDLKAMLHLVQKQPEDLTLLERMILKFNVQAKEMRFGTYVFGPVIMRACYFLDEPDVALKLFTNPKMGDFFHQFSSFKILLTLLYRHDRFNDMKTVYQHIKESAAVENGPSKQALVLLMAAAYKESTPEAYNYALEIWRDYTEDVQFLPLRAVFFFSCLSINNNTAHVAVELLSNIRDQRHIGVRNIRALAYAQLGRFNELLAMFRQSIDSAKQDRREHYFQDVITELNDKLENNNTLEGEELKKTIKMLQTNDEVVNTTLNEFLVRPIDAPLKVNTQDRYDRTRQHSWSERNTGYERNPGFDRNMGYDRNTGYDRNPGYDRNTGYDRNVGYDRNMGYDRNTGYDRNFRSDRYGGFEQNNMGQRRRISGEGNDERGFRTGSRNFV